jgi:hypothetical protein
MPALFHGPSTTPLTQNSGDVFLASLRRVRCVAVRTLSRLSQHIKGSLYSSHSTSALHLVQQCTQPSFSHSPSLRPFAASRLEPSQPNPTPRSASSNAQKVDLAPPSPSRSPSTPTGGGYTPPVAAPTATPATSSIPHS